MPLKLSPVTLLAVVVLVLAASIKARADIIVFTDPAAFAAASTNNATIDFEGIAPVNSVANFSTPLTIQGVTFSGADDGSVSVVDSGFFRPLFDFGPGAELSGFAFIEVTLPAGITSIGADIMSANPSASPFEIVFSSGESFTVETPFAPARGFVGFTSTQAVTALRFNTLATSTAPRGIPLLDNFSFGQAKTGPIPNPVPEPATMLLVGTGLAGIGGVIKKKRHGQMKSRR